MRLTESTTDLVIGQMEQLFESIPPLELPLSIRLPELLNSLNTTKGATQLSWAGYWTPPREWLRVNVLGTSVANGCGGAEPPHTMRCTDRKVETTARCDVQNSWVRHTHDALREWATDSGTRPTTTLHARNAMTGSYFGRCSKQFADQSTDVIVLDLSQVDGNNVPTLRLVVRSVRRHAPRAAVVAVHLPPKGKPPSTQWLAAARDLGVDVLRLDLLWRPLLAGHRLGACSPRSFLYASRGHDIVHPSPEGHFIFGQYVARFITDRLREASRSDAAPGIVTLPPAGARLDTLGHTEPVPLSEYCYAADAFPVVNGTPPWRLVDSGGSKGVQKLGLVSERIGDMLTLRPFANSAIATGSAPRPFEQTTNKSACCRGSVEIGYLLTPRETQGSFLITCEQCRCSRQKNTFAKQLAPFPGVETWSRVNPNPHYHEDAFNYSITATTVFDVARADALCTVRITHALRGVGHSSAKGRHAWYASPERNNYDKSAPMRVQINTINAEIVGGVRRHQVCGGPTKTQI